MHTVIHEWRLACMAPDLADLDVEAEGSGDESAGKFQYRREWSKQTWEGGPIFRWLEETLLPLLELPSSDDGRLNKAVVFTPLPQQAWVLHWFIQNQSANIESHIIHSGLRSNEHNEVLATFENTPN